MWIIGLKWTWNTKPGFKEQKGKNGQILLKMPKKLFLK